MFFTFENILYYYDKFLILLFIIKNILNNQKCIRPRKIIYYYKKNMAFAYPIVERGEGYKVNNLQKLSQVQLY
ncbi:hypothetical protein YYG_00709 [Plasmodium vinckei petteri]|uniref:Uncharacterized protein n=1 Tax=Plasmodium vinckei petteri TaxID=138298 RepID=W7B6N8_PLAVN|nr:hypothetical protein YYG_00709 [Plasmodium vinckei petteri]